MTDEATEAADAVRSAFDDAFESTAYELETVTPYESEDTGESFIGVVASLPSDRLDEEGPTFTSFVSRLLHTYIRLVDAGLTYPLEGALCIRTDTGERTSPFATVRASTLWVREHIHGNITLEGVTDRTLQTLKKAPEPTVECIQDWMSDYDADWRQTESELDTHPDGTAYDDWRTGGRD